MITNANTSKQLKNKRQEATKFNVLWFKNYDGTNTLKVITRSQYDRMMNKFNP
jgi:hypothetical protein